MYKLDLADDNKGFIDLSNLVDFMTSDLQPMCYLPFGPVLVLLHHIIGRLVYTGLYCFVISSSADCLFVIIFSSISFYIGHSTDSLKPYCYRLVSALAGITPSACQPIGYLIY